MEYTDYPQQQQQQQPSSQRGWPSQSFPTPTSPNPFYFPQTSPTNTPVATSPTNLNMRQGPFQDQQLHTQHPLTHPIPHHTHSHSTGSAALSVSPISPVSPGDFSSAHLSPQPNFSFNFDGASPNGALSPTPDSVLSQRRPSTGSHSTSSTELSVEKSVPRKRSLTTAVPTSHSTHSMHAHSQSHSGYTQAHGHSHPIITTTASSPPPPSPTSPSSSHASHSISLSHSHSHPSLSQQSISQSPSHPSFQSQTQLDINANSNPYDDLEGSFGIISDDVSDDEYGFAGASGSGGRHILRNLCRSPSQV
ncbi:hypothetical protein BKA82DRAFT_919675 [Pisolithus tinctorius]|uniref:Uncharacterized protein n=1 Tax=Pisolithus tinctorius Marx 270 TaxID=870435 RepID=A0A0C3IJ61_PISTI|nr:hypothetical protein BKA82DRAFT_919675 [Pisolithus tinctorius]KIN97027.1 hypothetical protein M404DRAFT_919675 [Pisolithus tinctorius Marx 270]